MRILRQLWPSRQKTRPLALVSSGPLADALARLEQLEHQQQVTAAEVDAVFRAFGDLARRARQPLPDIEDTQEMPPPLYAVKDERDSA